jgi:hypothetical protein
VSANKLVDHGAILRQMSGKGLFAAYDTHAIVPVAAPPATTPGSSGSGSGGRGTLAATGGLPLAGAGVLLLLVALAARRRRTA